MREETLNNNGYNDNVWRDISLNDSLNGLIENHQLALNER